MSKKHKNKNRVQDTMTPVATAPDTEATIEDMFAESLSPSENASTEEVQSQEAVELEAPVESEEKPVEQPKPVAESAAKPEPVVSAGKQLKVPTEKTTASELSNSRLSAMQRNAMANKQVTHTPAGLKLLNLFEEYKGKMSIKTNNRDELRDRIMILHRIVQTACPRKLTNRQVGADLIGILFDQLVSNWGTLFTDSNMFRLDYSLPGGPADIDKLNIFIEAMIQLVEAATGETDHIAFINERLQQVIDSEAIMIAIQNLRTGIEKRIAQRQKAARR